MIGAPNTPFVLRAWLIGALVALAVAIGFVAQQERAASLAVQSGDIAELSAIPGQLRIALALLLVVLVALGYLILVTARRGAGGSGRSRAIDADGLAPQSDADLVVEAGESSPQFSTEAGTMMATGGLTRRFCHELTNALNPIQGYAELLIGDERLSDLHRRHVAKIAQATAAALGDIQNVRQALNWSARRGTPVQLEKAIAEAASVARSASGASISVAVMPGGDVAITGSEAEIGQALLHACAAIGPLQAERDVKIDIKVDSFVGQQASGAEDVAGAGRRLEIWSDPFEPERTRIQYGGLQPSWRYGRVRFDCAGHGWSPELAGRLFTSDRSDHDIACLFMSTLSRLILNLGGAIAVDTRPLHDTHITMYWPVRIASQVAAPLEIDAAEDDLDALLIDVDEAAGEELSRRLTAFGLRVASTTSAETALELLGEMGSRCRAVMIGRDVDSTLAERVRGTARDCEVMLLGDAAGDADPATPVWPIDPDQETLERLVARLRLQPDGPKAS